MTAEDQKRAEQLEAEIEQSRARIDHTVDAIQAKLSPGQLVDQFVGYFRSSAEGVGTGLGTGLREYGSSLGDTVRSNPMPVALMGIGLAWLMMSGPRKPGEEPHYYYREARRYPPYPEDDYHPKEPPEEPYVAEWSPYVSETEEYSAESGTRVGETAAEMRHKVSETASETRAKMSETAVGARERIGETAGEVRRRVGETARHAGEAVHDARERVGRTAEELRHQAGETAGRVRARASETAKAARYHAERWRDKARYGVERLEDRAYYYGERTREGFGHMVQEQPLVLGAIGLALGAALGSSLPMTRREDEFMGETRDEMLAQARETGEEQLRKVQTVAGSAMQAARDEAERQHLTPEDGGEAFKRTKEKVEQVAGTAWEEAKREAERQGLRSDPESRP